MTQKAIKTKLLLLDRGGERGGGRKDFTGKEGGLGRGATDENLFVFFVFFFFQNSRHPAQLSRRILCGRGCLPTCWESVAYANQM